MCIRDRGTDNAERKAYSNNKYGLVEYSIRSGYVKISYKTVSYTHLDVYKRQELNLSDIGIGVNGDGETKTALFCVIPDSDKSYNFIISDYIDFIKHFGRAWADIEIFAFEGNETVVGYTQSLREVHAERCV